jgi:hypothetical protein
MPGCGGKEESAATVNSDGQVFDFTFENAESGDQFLLFPYVTGDPTEITGKTESTAGSFSMVSQGLTIGVDEGAALHRTRPFATSPSSQRHALRSWLNRTNFSQLARQNRDLANSGLNLSSVGGLSQATIERFANPSSFRLPPPPAGLTQSGSCPGEIFVPAADAESVDPTGNQVFDTDNTENFCVVYYKGTSTSEPDNSAIRQSLTRTLTIMSTVFADDFSTAADGGDYPFKPLLVILPFDDPSLWPAEVSSIAGAFVSSMSEYHLRPTLYIREDLTKAGFETNQANAAFHATLGHELFHALFHYYRVWVQGNGDGAPEATAIDEGFAHFFEDVVGYGEASFSEFPQQFLTQWTLMGLFQIAVLDDVAAGDPSATNHATARGAAQALAYFLVSQAGGLTFSDGTVSGGGGTEFLQTFVKGSTPGPAGLAAALNQSWPTLFGQFLKSLAVDNTIYSTPQTTVQSPVTDVTNLQGETGQSFGMRFTDFGAVPSLDTLLTTENRFISKSADDLGDVELHYYGSYPILITVENSDATLTLTFDQKLEGANAVSIQVR